MRKRLLSFFIILSFVLPNFAFALTEGQITSILSLLTSFGAEPALVAEVETSLRGDSVNCTFTEQLYRGISDEMTYGQVSRVQNILGVDPTTGYYGPITESAVQVFQIAHAIVSSGTPETTGFGTVGPKTRAKLTEVCEERVATNSGTNTQQETATNQNNTTGAVTTEDSGTSTPTITGTPTTGDTTGTTQPSTTISDDEYLDILRQEVYDAGVAQGVSALDLAKIDAALSELPDGPTSESDANGAPALAPVLSTALGATLNSLLQGVLNKLFGNVLSPSGVDAIGRDFGTPKVTKMLPCTCSGTVAVYMQPIAPDYIFALSYVPGSQQFESYNIPTIGQKLLGKYTSGGICLTGATCSPVYVQGMMTSFVGSSLQ